MSDMTLLILSGVLGYLLGSIPFGIVFTRLAGLGDIRQIGSGNIGATNVLRTGRKDLALMTLLCDSGTAALAAEIAYFCVDSEGIGDTAALIAGTMGVLGHNVRRAAAGRLYRCNRLYGIVRQCNEVAACVFVL